MAEVSPGTVSRWPGRVWIVGQYTAVVGVALAVGSISCRWR